MKHLNHFVSTLSALTCSGLISLGTLVDIAAVEPAYLRAASVRINAGTAAKEDFKTVQFFITANGIDKPEWKRIPDSHILGKGGIKPYYLFDAPADGAYGFITRWVKQDSDDVPADGTEPSSVIIIDRQKPKINQQEAIIDGDGIRVSWSSSDSYPSAKAIKISALLPDQSWAPLEYDLPMSGTVHMSIPLETTLRLEVNDQAGNILLGEEFKATASAKITNAAAQKINPKTSRTETTKATAKTSKNSTILRSGSTTSKSTSQAGAALAALPSPQDIDKVNKAVAQDDMRNDVAQKVAQLRREKRSAIKEQKVEEKKKTVAAADHKDIDAPYANKPWPEAYVTGNKKEKSDKEKAQEIESLHNTPFQAQDLAEVNRILGNRLGRILIGKDATLVLRAAQYHQEQHDYSQALFLYERLHNSDYTHASIPAEISLLEELGQLERILALQQNAPPEAASSLLLCATSKALIAYPRLNKPLIDDLERISPTDDRYREAQYYLALLYWQHQKKDTSRAILSDLSIGDDQWAQKAQNHLNTHQK